MRDTDQDVRKQAIWALGRIENPKAVDALTAALKDGNPEVRRSAAQALAHIYGSGRYPNPNPNPNPNPRPRPF
jgi:HEAT repeat protein